MHHSAANTHTYVNSWAPFHQTNSNMQKCPSITTYIIPLSKHSWELQIIAIWNTKVRGCLHAYNKAWLKELMSSVWNTWTQVLVVKHKVRCPHFLVFSGWFSPVGFLWLVFSGWSIPFILWRTQLSLSSLLLSILGRFLQGAMHPNNSWPTAQWALVSWFLSLLTRGFAGGLAATLIEEATTWLVHGGALAIVLLFELAANTYFLSCTFVHTTLTFSSTLLSFMRVHVVSLAWGWYARPCYPDSHAESLLSPLDFCKCAKIKNTCLEPLDLQTQPLPILMPLWIMLCHFIKSLHLSSLFLECKNGHEYLHFAAKFPHLGVYVKIIGIRIIKKFQYAEVLFWNNLQTPLPMHF